MRPRPRTVVEEAPRDKAAEEEEEAAQDEAATAEVEDTLAILAIAHWDTVPDAPTARAVVEYLDHSWRAFVSLRE